MANRLYDKGRQKFLEGAIAWLTDNIKVVCVDGATYTPNTATDEFLSSIPVGERVATSADLSGKTSTDGIADAADPTITGVTGDQFEYVVVYKDTGTAATSPLICIFDTGTGLPFTPSGGNITIVFDNGANKVFKL